MKKGQPMKRAAIFLILFLPVSLLVGLGYVVNGRVQAKPQLVDVGGTLTTDSTWTAANSPYVLTSTLTIPEGITLTVEPGVTVLGQSYGGIVVEGKIVAIGTPTNPITFTSSTDSAPGEWPGFFFWDGAGQFEHVVIRYGGENVSDPVGGLPPSGANLNIAGLAGSEGVTIRNSTIHGSNGFGLFVPVDFLHLLHMENVTFTQNITNRVQILDPFGIPIVSDVTLSPQPGLEGYEFDKSGLVVAEGTLTLEPGTTLISPTDSAIVLQGGHLTAVGTPEQPITFTSVTDSAASRWGGIFFWDGSAELIHTRIRYAGEDVGQQAVSTLHVYEVPDGQEVVLEDSIIEGSGGYAIAVEVDNLHQLHLQNNQFTNNALNRILVLPDIDGGDGSLAGSAAMPGQNGLESYELLSHMVVPATMTLTLGAGATLMMPDMGQFLDVQGHLEVAGTAVNPVLITSSGDLPSNQWLGINVTSGSAHFAHTTLRYAETPLFIFSEVGGDVMLENSTIEENSVYPIFLTSEALHRLKMNNVSFSNNVPNRIAIELNSAPGVMATLSGDVLLTPQPGLEAYEIIEGAGTFTVLNVPQGITLSLAAGTVVLSDNVIIVDGRIEANGTELEPVIFEDGFGPDKYYLFFAETGSASLVHTTIQHAGNVGIGIGGQSDEPVTLQDVLLTDIEGYPIVVEAWALHRLQMTNVTFQNNTYNRVVVDTDGGQDAIAADVTLTAQPGLTWYEFADGSTPQTLPEEFVVPEGVTLTVEPGVQLRFGNGAETLVVNGRLQASGTPTQPITFTSAADSAPGQWEGIILQGGSSQLENVVVRNGRENLLIDALDPGAAVQIANSTIAHSSQTPLGIRTANLHQAELANITFADHAAGENIVLYGEPTLGGTAVLNDQPGLDAYVILDGNTSHWFVVPPTATLSINPGVTLKFNESGGDFGLWVEGELHTAGTQAEPVILTSQTDSAPGSGMAFHWKMAWLNWSILKCATPITT
jgi:hypothetical protein